MKGFFFLKKKTEPRLEHQIRRKKKEEKEHTKKNEEHPKTIDGENVRTFFPFGLSQPRQHLQAA